MLTQESLNIMLQADVIQLRKVVEEAIAQGRLGRPQFLRCIAQARDPDRPEQTLVTLVALVESWFATPFAQRFDLESDPKVSLTQMLTWSGGQGALITISVQHAVGNCNLDLMLIGSRGTLYFEH